MFLPESLEQLAELRAALTAAGHSRAKVAGCIEFVLGRAEGDDRTRDAERAEYRRMLAHLLEPAGRGKGA